MMPSVQFVLMLKPKFTTDINGWPGLNPDLLKLITETLNSKIRDAGPMDSSSNHSLTTPMLLESFNSCLKMWLDSSQIMLESNSLKKLNQLLTNCLPTVICSNKMHSRNSNPSLKLGEKEQLENKSFPFYQT
jgi:hypothetical protein